MAITGRTTVTDSPEARAASGELTGDEYMNLVRSKDVSARIAAASRPDAPLGALIAFTQDQKPEVRTAVASNPGIGRTTTVIARLSDDKSIDVVRALIDNPAVPHEAIEKIAADGPRAARSYAQARLS
jgi:hypothetical protein